MSAYVGWFNEHRPHQSLDGRTPLEVYKNLRPANDARRFELRPEWTKGRKPGASGVRSTLVVCYHEGRRHLPIIELRQAA